MRKFFNWFFPLLLASISLFVAFRNYTPGTWLLGWDNLVPELHFGLNISRSFSAVWQEYQGLGLLGGMAHAAALSREIILWLASLFLPDSFLRYFWTFLMLLIGPLGVYFLIRFGKGFVGSLAAFSGALFYLFNLATLQTFFTPFETFVSFYGFFPWLLFLAQSYLRHGGRVRLILFALVSFIAASAFYVQTLFIVYAIFLALFALETVIRIKKTGLDRSFKLALTTFFVNSFWLLPVIYFAIVSPGIPGNSHINSIATPETQIMNQARNSFVDVASLKGYWFDYFDWGENGSYDYLYKDWISYSNQPLVKNISIGLFIIAFLGLILGLIRKRRFKYSYLILFIISMLMLFGMKLPDGFIKEAFRNAFTKWATPASLVYSLGIASFIGIIGKINKRWIGVSFSIIASVCIILASLYTVLPVFSGRLIADSMKVNLPQYYLDAIDYFKSVDPTKRVVMFPLTDFWGWQFNDWGYRGSGFLWYGVPQPMLSRTFDVWSPKNESFYSEISHAVNSEDSENLKYVLAKYQIGYVLFDESIYLPGNPNFTKRVDIQKQLILNSGVIGEEKQFGKVRTYRVNDDRINSFISAPKNSYEGSYVKLGQAATEPITRENFSENQGYQTAKNCGLKGLGAVVKEKKDGGNYYRAEHDGVSCDYFYYPELDSSKAYQMRIVGKNLEGRSLKFYLLNVTNQVVMSEHLLPAGNFDRNFIIQPVTPDGVVGDGYTLNVETRSFGKVKSENIITSIEFYPLDFSYNSPAEISNNLDIRNVKKYSTWAYKVDVEGYGLLQLGQGYEKGWVAFWIQDSKPRILDHQLFNGWSNAWDVPSTASVVYIFYWPQLLEWGGMLLGAITLLTLLRHRLY